MIFGIIVFIISVSILGVAAWALRSAKKSEALLKDDPAYEKERRIMYSLKYLSDYTFARRDFTADQQLMRYDRIDEFAQLITQKGGMIAAAWGTDPDANQNAGLHAFCATEKAHMHSMAHHFQLPNTEVMTELENCPCACTESSENKKRPEAEKRYVLSWGGAAIDCVAINKALADRVGEPPMNLLMQMGEEYAGCYVFAKERGALAGTGPAEKAQLTSLERYVYLCWQELKRMNQA